MYVWDPIKQMVEIGNTDTTRHFRRDVHKTTISVMQTNQKILKPSYLNYETI